MLEDREAAQQQCEAATRRLGELTASVTSLLNIPRGAAPNITLQETVAGKLGAMLQV